MDDLTWLAMWFRSRCDGRWEHEKGIRIESIDNPGFWIHVDVEPSASNELLEVHGEPPSVANGYIAPIADWMQCEIKNGEFSGAGDPTKLGRIIACFRRYIERGA